MGHPQRLGAADLAALTRTFRDLLRGHQAAINRLNVYPVPDGDTGTNMALTLESVCAEIDGQGAEPTLAEVCRAIAHGSLMGARGNSGVILSQILRGLADVWRDGAADGGVDGRLMATACTAAAKGAYAAVLRPVEGTILTVAREAAEAAEAAALGGGELVAVLAAAEAGGRDALARTPELLAVLADAGVVDAGGTGLVLWFAAARHVLEGTPLPEPPAEGPDPVLTSPLPATRPDDGAHGHPGDLRYEVMYLLDAPDHAIAGFKDVWGGLGDSIVVVGGDGLWNCHIHTNDIGGAIEAAIDCGRPHAIRVTDLHDEVEEERWVRDAPAPADADPGAGPAVTTAVVAVASGPGLRRILHSLGVQGIVAGGQSMNPSTAELLAAVEASPASSVVVLPNNKNIIPVAEQLDGLTTKAVRVVPTRSITEGFAALVAYDPDGDVAHNAAAMAASAEHVVAGEVTRAVRDAPSEAGPVATGDWLGLGDGQIRVVAPDLVAAACGLLEVLVVDGHEIVTLVEGEGSSGADTRRITAWLAEHRPDVTAEVHQGGQPLYPYLFGIE